MRVLGTTCPAAVTGKGFLGVSRFALSREFEIAMERLSVEC